MSGKIMIVEDDAAVQRMVAVLLEMEGYTTIMARNGAEALRLVDTENPDLILLDLMLPDLNGLEVCQQLRTRTYIPIIMLTAKSDEIDKVLGLEMGADDYMTKPFHERELLARVRAHLRRATVYSRPPQEQGQIKVGGLLIASGAREVTMDGRSITLTPKEFDLLEVLARNPGRVMERDRLLEKVWGENLYLDSRTLDVHIRRLRLKIEADPSHPQYILTVPGVGYKLRAHRPG